MDRVGSNYKVDQSTKMQGQCEISRNFRVVFIGLLLAILLLSSAASAAQVLQVSSSRHSLFSPWTGKSSDASLSANFTAYALLLDTNGTPVSEANITFEIYSRAGIKATKYNNTQKNGLASVPYDTINDFTASTDTDYGNWSIVAYLTSNPALKDEINMSIQAGGSGLGSGCSKDYCHETAATDAGGYPRSPYTDSYGQSNTRAEAAHTKSKHANAGCYYCHPGYAATKTGTYGYTGDVHKNRTCDFCHGTWTYIKDTGSTGGKGIPKMPSCSDCHLLFNNNLTDMNTLANLAAGNSISVYSYNYDRKAPLTAHNGTDYSLNKSVPCIVCHGPAHNNIKPDPNKANTNDITEYTQCISCHNSYNRHNNSVSCTVCHSQDAHVIGVFSQSASYIIGTTGSSRGNCTNCHQNSSFFGALLSKPKAGSYAGKNPAVISSILNHSNDPIAGTKWNLTPGYWTPANQLSTCGYCHGDTKHRIDALGKPSTFAGGNIINATISSGTWCSSCHWQGYSNYSDMTRAFENESRAVPPEITGNKSYAPFAVSGYVNHSTYDKADSSCRGCHGGSKTYITEFMHDVLVGTGGETCIECHGTNYTDASPSVSQTFVDISAFNESIHQNINAAPLNTVNNVDCWSCHYNKDMQRENVNKCGDCHRKPKQWHGNANVTTNLSELW